MKFAASLKFSMLLLVVAALTACGGGGGSGSDNPFTPAGVTMSASTSNLSINTRSAISISVRMTQSGGAPVANGTRITGTVNGTGIGNLSALGSQTNGPTSSHTTAGGVVNFYFQTGVTAGTGSIIFSAQDPLTPGRNISTTVNVTVNVGPSSDPRVTFLPEKTTMPINTRNVPFFIGSPYISEVIVHARSASGQAINSTRDDAQAIQYSIDPVELGAVSVLDDPDTDDVNELTTRWGAIFDGITSGTGHAFVWANATPGTIFLRATFTDPDTGQRAEGVQAIQIVSSVPPLPAGVIVRSVGNPIYASNSGGPSSGQAQIFVDDGNGIGVPNPSGNNVRAELILVDGGDARLSATNAAGQLQEGTVVSVRTTDGVANVQIRGGLRTGTYKLRATADRADNNIDNGITDPIVGENGIVISDGRLFNIEITQPVPFTEIPDPRPPTQFINPVDPSVNIPATPDGSYSLTVAAIATDRLGNPVLPGTLIQFGLIDHPQVSGVGDFQIFGADGNPQEAGTLFTTPTGAFTTAGGGAGPGDAVAIFGKAVTGNRDHESARVVQSVNSATSITVQRRFNRNDDTGTIVDSGNALPYVIGRAVSGNIVAEGATNDLGVARTLMTYPTSRLGRTVVVWAQGEADNVNGVPETAADVDFLSFAGLAPLQITASPSTIPGNTTAAVQVCVTDALGSPLQGVVPSFFFTIPAGTGSVNGTSGSGSVGTPTGTDGCTIANVVTGGVSGQDSLVTFTVIGAADPAEVEIVVGDLVLQARPSVVTSASQLVTLTLLNGGGVPQPGFLIVGECEALDGTIIALSNGPGVTNASGQTTVQITTTGLDQVNQPGGGSCTFSTVSGDAETTVEIIGQDLCEIQLSPLPTGCTPPTTFTVTLNLTDAVGGTSAGVQVASTPSGLTCSAADGTTQSCVAPFAQGTDVGLGALDGLPLTWVGGCVGSGGNPSPNGFIGNIQANVICNATRNP